MVDNYLVRAKNSAGDGNLIAWFPAADAATARTDITSDPDYTGTIAVDIKRADPLEASYGGYATQTTLASILAALASLPASRYTANSARGQVASSTTQAAVSIARPTRIRLRITNTDASNIAYVSATGVLSTTGHAIMPKTTEEFTDVIAYFAITASSTAQLTYNDEYA